MARIAAVQRAGDRRQQSAHCVLQLVAVDLDHVHHRLHGLGGLGQVRRPGSNISLGSICSGAVADRKERGSHAWRPSAPLSRFDRRVAIEPCVVHSTGYMSTIYKAAGGWDGMLKLARAWHARVLEDEVVSHAFSHGYHPQHAERLAAYWAEALGGPPIYSNRYGDESHVVRIHSGNGTHAEMDERAITCFDQALKDTGLAGNESLQRSLHDYFAWTTTNTMARYPNSAADVPSGLNIPKWSWSGLASELDDR